MEIPNEFENVDLGVPTKEIKQKILQRQHYVLGFKAAGSNRES
jgi:hypothetical protein